MKKDKYEQLKPEAFQYEETMPTKLFSAFASMAGIFGILIMLGLLILFIMFVLALCSQVPNLV